MIIRLILSGAPTTEIIQALIFSIIAVLIAMTFHEFSHAFAAYKFGDPTAKNLGRMTLNPIKHMNPVGMVLLLLFGFGWANPVIINPNNFRHKRAGMIVTAAAGPLMNFLLSFINLFIYIFLAIYSLINETNVILTNLSQLFYYISMYNMSLGIFNLIPLPPLDGSKIVAGFLPRELQYKYLSLERYSMIIFIALILLLNNTNFLSIMMNGLYLVFYSILAPIVLKLLL